MVKDAINRQWRSDFVNKTSKKPVMIVGIITEQKP
jgi:hypothetical protein